VVEYCIMAAGDLEFDLEDIQEVDEV